MQVLFTKVEVGVHVLSGKRTAHKLHFGVNYSL